MLKALLPGRGCRKRRPLTSSPQAPSLRSGQALSRQERGFCDTLWKGEELNARIAEDLAYPLQLG